MRPQTVLIFLGWVTLTGVLAIGPNTATADWTSFRNGGSSTTSASLPLAWSPESGIRWQLELEGYGQSAPVVQGERVYVTAVVGDQCETLRITAHDLRSGDLKWEWEVPTSEPHPSNYMRARAAPTPVVDPTALYAFFESGDLVAVDLDGKPRWHRLLSDEVGTFDNNHGIGSSPAANDSHLFLNLDHGGPSSLVAIRKADGATEWTADRESAKAWSSPIVTNVGGQSQVIISSGGTVIGYDAATGNDLWRLDGMEGNSVPSPTVIGNHLLIGARLPEFATDGDVRSNACLDLSRIEDGKPVVLWRADKAICEYASPVSDGSYAYFVNKANVLHCLSLESGEIAYRQRLGFTPWATPIISAGRLYLFGKNGQCDVIRCGPIHQPLASNKLWDLDNPPTPEHYREASSGPRESRPGGGRGGPSMLERLRAADADGDGVLSAEEIPDFVRPMLARIDTNQDGQLDAAEMEAAAASFAAQRRDSASMARDPILYGVAASDGYLVLRTGTRLYGIAER